MPGERTLRPPEELNKLVTGDISKLNKRLLKVARRPDADARAHRIVRTPPGMILLSFYRKMVNTFSAIEVMKRHRHIEEAWILLRVLLETHVNFVYFLKGDGRDMYKRYVHAAILDKIKHLREVDFYKDTPLAALHDPVQWEQDVSEIKKEYSQKDFNAICKHGFTGLNFQQRAQSVGLKTMYECCYRIASRSIHVFDPAETPVYSVAFKGRGKEKRELLKLRREQLEFNQNMLLGRPSYLIAEMIHSPLASIQLLQLGLGYEKFRDKISGRAAPGLDAPGTFRIWRE